MIMTKLNLLTNIFIRFLLKSSFTLPPISELPSVVSLISDIFVPESDVFSELSLLDTSKTGYQQYCFDSVPHNELLLKLWNIGITGNLWLWFKAYLTSHNQVVSVNKAFSDSLPVLSGVPQGSILGPLLFLILINDLHQSNRSSSLLLFADDAKCFRMIQSPSDCLLLQSDLSRLSNWSSHWKLSFNELKCTLIHFSPNSPEFIETFTLNQHQLSVSNSCKDLGVILTSNLDFSDH